MPKKLPRKLPNVWPGVLGPIKIKLVKDLKDESDHYLWGWAIFTERVILLEKRMLKMDPVFLWRTFFHEVGHMWMEDTGRNVSGGADAAMTKAEREAWCEAYATSRVAEMLNLK